MLATSTIIIIALVVACIILGICGIICHFVGEGGRSFDPSPAPVLGVRPPLEKHCSCHEEFQGTCEDCQFVVRNGNPTAPPRDDGDKGFFGTTTDDTPTGDPFRGFLDKPVPEETIPLSSIKDTEL